MLFAHVPLESEPLLQVTSDHTCTAQMPLVIRPGTYDKHPEAKHEHHVYTNASDTALQGTE